MVSERVGDSLSGRPFCFRKSKSEAQRAIAFGAVVCCASSYLSSLPSGRAGVGLPLIHRKGSARRMQSRARSSYAEPQPSLAVHLNALQRYYNNLAPPNLAPRSVQISVKETTDKS